MYTGAVIYILGLLARSGHGKTTVAQHLVSTYGAEVRSLAGPMKRALQNVFGFSTAQLWGTQAEKEATDSRYGFSPRWLLQRLGRRSWPGLQHLLLSAAKFYKRPRFC